MRQRVVPSPVSRAVLGSRILGTPSLSMRDHMETEEDSIMHRNSCRHAFSTLLKVLCQTAVLHMIKCDRNGLIRSGNFRALME
jgi:hypothetical protein